jgi:hypothetical protein
MAHHGVETSNIKLDLLELACRQSFVDGLGSQVVGVHVLKLPSLFVEVRAVQSLAQLYQNQSERLKGVLKLTHDWVLSIYGQDIIALKEFGRSTHKKTCIFVLVFLKLNKKILPFEFRC